MPKNKKIILTVLISIGILGMFIAYSNTPPPNLPLVKGEEKGGGQAVLEIDNIKYEDEIAKGASVYDFMNKLQSEGKINFTEKNYAGIGKFIESINGVKGNGDRGWIYYVNGKEAQVGVSNYKIKPGDVVSWKYEKNY